MDFYRLKHTLALCLTRSDARRAEYIRKKNIFRNMGKDCGVMLRVIPLYPQLISLQDNVWIASNVTFVTHDISNIMLNHLYHTSEFKEKIGCIEVGNNCYIGAGAIIMPDVKIGDNTVIGAGCIVSKDLEGNGVYVGVPARKIMSFDEYVEKNRRRSAGGPKIIREKGNELNSKIIEETWNKFNEKRAKK